MKDTDTIQIQIEAESLFDLIAQATGQCTELFKCCKAAISEGDYGLVDLPCRYACENEATRELFWKLFEDNDALKKMFPIFWKKQTFHAELQTILGYLHTWDPNGDWDEYDVLDTPLQTIEVLENLKEELEDCYQTIPGWVDKTIDYLMLFLK